MTVHTFEIAGKPRPQGSLRLARNPHTGKEFATYSTSTVEHRNLAIATLHQAWAPNPPRGGAIALDATFRFPRPASHHGTGRNAGTLKATAPTHMTVTPDLDKLLRLIGDALVIAGIIEDDSQIVTITARKLWADQRIPGTTLKVTFQ